ncbi:Spatacsin [Habropoda laboriosa]|uniref:Spatacsin n=1 Tax=Habropoda laboriosa TaxID=597456 RepID=A0A0L7QMN9_9HYME|nr:Spatacsin [Habropoda laboriosa]
MAAIKYYILISRGGKIGQCVKDIRADWSLTLSHSQEEEREIMRDSARIGRSLAIFCAGFMYSGGFFYTTVMPLCTVRTEIIDNETVRSQAFPIYRGLLDPRTSPSFEIVQFMQCLAAFVIYSVTVGACSLAAVFVMHVCGQFRILVTKLDKLVDGVKGRKGLSTHEQRLGDIIEHHLKILGFISQIEGLLNEICFVEVIGCTLNICFLGYYLLTEWEQSETIGTITYCTLLVSFTFNVFILCYIGEILSEQCLKVGLSTYMIDWYRLPGKTAQGLILIFAVSNSSIKLTAGKIIDLSLSSFCSVESLRDREMMLKYGQMGRNLTIICAIFMYTGGTIYHTVMQFATGTYVDEYNRTIKPLVYPTYSALFDVQTSPIYELVYFVHCMCGYVIYSITAGACGLAALFATHACGQIDIVMSRLGDLVNSKESSDLDKRLIEIVEHHLRILRFSAIVQTVLQEVCFLEFIGSTLLICLLEYYCITSSSVGLSCFMISWYHLPTKTIHGLILIIAMSSNPAKISAGKVVDLSLSTFGNVIGGIPIECLTGESVAIWSGWRTLEDRELVREASAKGTHIDLACKCLAWRKTCSIENAQDYFNQEVETWVMELLRKHQIYRASHILNNMSKNPMEFIFEICMNCKDSTLRDYLAEHLIKVLHFETEHINSWNILKSIVQFEQKYMIKDGLSSSLCINDIIKLPEVIKQALCTELYFSVTEQSLLKSITNSVLWDYLLSNNKIEMIRFWIDIYYGSNTLDESNEINEDYKSLFTTLDIVPNMIEAIDSSNATTLVKDLTKNHLCRYGVFAQKEKQDVKLLLARIFSSAMTISELNTILSYKSCNITKTEFKRIDKELCLARCLNQTDTQVDKSKITKLYDALTQMCESQQPFEDALIEGIFKTIFYLSDDVNEYLKQNYLIVLVLIFSYLSKNNITNNQNKDTHIRENILKDIFTNQNDLQLGAYSISNEVLQHTLKQVPILECIIKNKQKEEVTMYDLLDGYKNLNVKHLYEWRFNNEPMPHFSNEALAKKYGYTETLTYEYYLKEARPTMALLTLKRSQGKVIRNTFSRRKHKAALYAHILALQNLDKPEVLCTCISFIEMLGIDSENLRLHITVANYIHNEINVPTGNLLTNIMYRNEDDLITIMFYLENSFQANLTENLIEDSQQFVNILKMWDIIVRFARAHNFPLPVSLLEFLASHNHWFEFVLICHIFTYPLNQVLESIKHFEDTTLKEHLQTCLNNTQLTKSQLTVCTEQKIKSRDTRQTLYYKIGVKQSESPISGSPVSTNSASTSDSHSMCEYVVNDNICSPDDDLWSIILKCHQSPDPSGALINSSCLTSRPFLTVLATCYEPSSTAVYCYSWMVISTRDKEILSNYKECLEQQIWTANQESPFNLFFEFLTQCVNGDFKECQQKLLEFKEQCSNLKCNVPMDWNCSDNMYLNNVYWVATVTIKCVIATLAYNLRQDVIFTRTFQGYLQIIKILQKTNVTLNFAAFTISNNVHNYDTEIQRCISDLLKSENYDSALELSDVAKLNSSEIILAQYRSKFKYYMHKNGKIEDNFWSKCALNFKKYNVPHKKATEFFIEHAERDTSHKERYEILKLAFETLKNVEAEQQNIDVLEVAMWKSCILAGPENIQLDRGPHIFNKLKTELLSGLNKLKFCYALSTIHEKNATENLINKLIDLGKLDTALRISIIFNYEHKDLQILLLCLSLAEGEISPNELTIEQQNLLKDANKYVISSTNINESKPKEENIHKVQVDCLSILQKSLDILEHGLDICLRIVLCYKLATKLGKSYQLLLTLNNPTQFLQDVAESGFEDNVSLWGYSLNTNFRVIMELCNDVSLLGWQLLNTVRLVTGVGRFTEMNYIFHILKENYHFELLLGKGLNKVTGLKTALLEFLKRHCPEDKDLFTLVALHFQLYHEIALMWENEAKTVIETLILDAIKDHDKLQNAIQHDIKFIRTENVQKQLQLTITNYCHAAEHYLKANKLNLAIQCSNQAQLIALQLTLLNAVPSDQQVICILNLKSEDIDKVLYHSNLNFSQILLVIHAYNHHVDWANLIYNRCILNGETKYLKDFIVVNKVTPGLVKDCVCRQVNYYLKKRYRLEKNITHTMTDNMKILISELSDVECKYVLASQLGFKTIVETMLNDPMIDAYLKDTVWKKGYNAT